MGKVVLDAGTTSALDRITVHSQYNNWAFGFTLLNNLVPIVINIRKPGPHYQRAILVFGEKKRERSPYEDFGIVEKCCRKVYTFNIRHYIKCYLNAPNPEPYTFNLCQVCGASIVDDNGHTIQNTVTRSYRPDKFVWKAQDALQDEAGASQIFNHHKGIV